MGKSLGRHTLGLYTRSTYTAARQTGGPERELYGPSLQEGSDPKKLKSDTVCPPPQ